MMVPRVSEALEGGAIVVRPPWQGFEEAVRGLVGALVTSGQLRADLAEEAVLAVIDREAMSGTAVVEIGVSIPHARLEGVNNLIAAVAVSPSGVYYAMTAVPITIMVLVLSSPSLTGEQLNFLSSLSLLLQPPGIRQTLRKASTASEVLECIRAQERLR